MFDPMNWLYIQKFNGALDAKSMSPGKLHYITGLGKKIQRD